MESEEERRKPHFMELNIFELGLLASRDIDDIIEEQIRRGLTPPVDPPIDLEKRKKSKSSIE